MKHLGTAILILSLTFSPFAYAAVPVEAQLENLMKEMKNMRQDYEARITELQSQVVELSKSVKTQPMPVEKLADQKGTHVDYVGRYDGPFQKGGLIVENPSGFGNVSVGGYMDHEFAKFEDTNSEFDQHRWIINIGAELGERLRFYSEYEIEHGGPSVDGGEAKVEQAWVDYLINEKINARAGALLVPFGRYNLYHDSDLQDLTDRPIVNRDVIPTTWTEAGAGFWGEFNPRIGSYEDLTLSYETYIINGLDTGGSDTGLGSAKGSLGSDNNNSKSYVGRLLLSPKLGHELGLSGYYGDYNTADDDIWGIGIDWLSTFGPLELVGEWAFFGVEEPAGSNVANKYTGFYFQANYHFWPEFLSNSFLGRTFDNPTFTLVNRYGWVNISDDSDLGFSGAERLNLDNREQRYTIGLNYRPVESWVLKLEYQFNTNRGESLEKEDRDGFIASVAMGF
ncbi:MAG: hypothetical protein COV74_09350 [Candidatus Omnitrophica bacterium CG11_big_fil_rev_8_21_14_0_20_45_26]|uniref:Porin n=1 Tax=Candidatus Abzuiibacterium crystallinum TaxID=1974748 RepID=A0A2H0LLL6_9BACT|nr:MAG: hypothetical protein COV74_09350 [Candidatus Omnitrophica bacterium CG11_big_fil_rev_8_21_14_0_20_45_26]PIW65358.1 MAG: hypothetical protein COW12_02290 [Candidatus Omnitrophica bacterium CG12_big_fil_rev_8_21_14_0_65_45_16]